MVGSHKILTVSYGTFSCTLEGFDDSFDTMKAIAEYFRDLAADDRYFGAEPPQPDAEMLARIAEREIARRVEARMEASGIVLRVGQSLDQGAATPAPAMAQPAAAASVAPRMPPAPAPAEEVAPSAAAPMPAAPVDTVAAKLQRIRAVVGRGAALPVTPPVIEDAVEEAEEDAPLATTGALAALVAEANRTQPDTMADAISEVTADLMPADLTADRAAPVLPDDLAAGAGLADVLPDTLSRDLPETVAESRAATETDLPAPAEAAPAPAADLLPEAVTDSAPATFAGLAATTPDAVLSEAPEALAPAPDAVIATTVDDAPDAPAAADPDAADDLAQAGMAADAPATAADEATALPAADATTAATPSAVTEPAAALATADAAETADTPTVPTVPIRARVVRMRKADFDRAVAAGTLAPLVSDEVASVGPDRAADLAEAEERAAAYDDDADDLVGMDELAELADLSGYDDLDDLDSLARMDAPGLSPDAEADLLAELEAVERDEIAARADSRHTDDLPDLDDDLGAELAAIAAGLDDDAMDLPASVAAETAPEMAPELAPELAAATSGLVSAAIPDDADPIANVLRALQAEPAAPAPQAMTQAEEPVAEEPDLVLDMEPDVAPVVAMADDAAPTAPPASAEMPVDEPARARFPAPEADEAALARLMSQTDAQMSGPDAARRREAIAQLRAAVAATEAARALGDTADSAQAAEDSFREDLRQAVRPRRPVAGEADLRSERPRPAPLKLVASQRIDLPAAQAPTPVVSSPVVPARPVPGQPIRPRRVTIDQTPAADAPPRMADSTATAAATADSFADFAERMGATSLADLLEAAAAYTAFVEGSGDFSRPQVLRRVSQISPEASREDGLRSFGTLLREGRIRRSERAGRFELAEDTRFNPDRRAI